MKKRILKDRFQLKGSSFIYPIYLDPIWGFKEKYPTLDIMALRVICDETEKSFKEGQRVAKKKYISNALKRAWKIRKKRLRK